MSFQSDACQALTKVLVFWGGCDMDWGMDELGGTQLSSRDYFKEVCVVAFKLYLVASPINSKYCWLTCLKSCMFVWHQYC